MELADQHNAPIPLQAEAESTPQAGRALTAENTLRSIADTVLGDCEGSYCKFEGEGGWSICSYSCQDDVYDML